ncbi:hypothetical protein KXQ82_16820 [Mucilaginibacter sp. HMF5004]|uniref:hypothetical protein n=1 Tax=Mucilaginibacter rivuli TaxID=2857527 RepID=UPI001C5F0F40|nr:hypothetical protein [Mucilaginibacter rivuli]MBW4891394.1 hypothetical protein [Mucilaginibacter rivuli]
MKSTEEEGLDNIFKQRLKEPDSAAEYRESDWDAFEQMLDGEEKKRPVILWLRIAGGIAAALLLVFGWLYMQTDNATKPAKQNMAVSPAVKDTANAVTITTPPIVNNTDNVTPAQDNKSGGGEHQITVGSAKTPYAVKGGHILAMSKHQPKGRSAILSAHTFRHDTAVLVNDNDVNNKSTVTLAAISNNKIDAYGINHVIDFSELKNDTVVSATDISTTIKGIQINKHRPQYAIAVLAASNINGVNSFKEAEVGADVGLQFSVSVSKFTFTTGAVYAKTPYLTPFSSYHTAYPFVVNPVNVSADCRVLDIPLNIAYQVYSKSGNKFSVGSGLSSYIMLKENYRYNYATPYTYGPQGVNIVNQNQHFLGVLNLNTTYQRRLSSKLSLDIQPYLKIPLTDIGYSRVKLQTAGVAFGLSWNLNSLAKP